MKPILRLVLTLSLASAAAQGCDNWPVQDKFKYQGGMAPDPAGVIEGSVVYVGPRPTCKYEGKKPVAVVGRVILTMFHFDNPPPPEGRATTADNLLAINGDQLFGLGDCLPKGKKPDPHEKIMRSVPFRWPQIALTDGPVDYQIRGFFDYDADMNPFFGITNLPTAGDIIGAALVSLEDPRKGFLRVTMPAREKARKGYLEQGVVVGLGNYVWSERPVVKVPARDRMLSAEEPLPVALDFSVLGPDPALTLRNTWELTCHSGDGGCGFGLQSLDPKDAPALAAAGVQLDFSPEGYAFFIEPVDIMTIVQGGPDKAQPDGIPDPHPVLGASLPLPFLYPAVVLQRRALDDAQADIEARARIPSVTLVGSLLPDEIATKKVVVGNLDVAVPPVAVVQLDPTNPSCQLPYIPPGNFVSTYEDRLAYCHELPTGVYGVNVLHGVAGGTRKDVDAKVSDNGFVIEGSSYSGQAWSLPNELGDPAQVGREHVLAHQGEASLFIVHDPHPGTSGDCKQATDPFAGPRDVVYRKVCKSAQDPRVESTDQYGVTPGIDGPACLPAACCDAVAHLCGVPLCGIEQVEGHNVRKGPTKVKKTLANGVVVPDCVPYELPELCCPPSE